jgi:FkbM family methyltransferase
MSILTGAKLAFDIGAYTGGKSQEMLDAGVKKLVCIEANPHTFQRLTSKFATDNRVTLVNSIMCDEDTPSKEFFCSKMHPPISTANSRFVTESRFSNKADENNVPYRWDETVSVKSKTLDSLVTEYGIPDFIKIDVEGNEFAVMSGFNKFLEHTLLTFEFHEEFEDVGIECIEHLYKLGYNKFGLINGDDINEFPKKYHTKSDFLDRINQAFPSQSKEFFGMVFIKYE